MTVWNVLLPLFGIIDRLTLVIRASEKHDTRLFTHIGGLFVFICFWLSLVIFWSCFWLLFLLFLLFLASLWLLLLFLLFLASHCFSERVFRFSCLILLLCASLACHCFSLVFCGCSRFSGLLLLFLCWSCFFLAFHCFFVNVFCSHCSFFALGLFFLAFLLYFPYYCIFCVWRII